MKKILFPVFLFAFILSGIIFFSSCEKCATCTYDDPINGKDTSDCCGKGNTYKSCRSAHEKNGWKCVEN